MLHFYFRVGLKGQKEEHWDHTETRTGVLYLPVSDLGINFIVGDACSYDRVSLVQLAA